MYLTTATMKAVGHFEPHNDDFMEALAAGVNWKKNLEDTVSKGGCVMIQPFGPKEACEVFPMAIGGCVNGQCWFVTTTLGPEVDRRKFTGLIKGYRDEMLEHYPVLWNYVWVGNKSHYRFLKILGAVFHNEFQESPITGERFQLFTISRR